MRNHRTHRNPLKGMYYAVHSSLDLDLDVDDVPVYPIKETIPMYCTVPSLLLGELGALKFLLDKSQLVCYSKSKI